MRLFFLLSLVPLILLTSCSTVSVINTEAWIERTASIDSIRSDIRTLAKLQAELMENQKSNNKSVNAIKADLSILYSQLNVNINQVKSQLEASSNTAKTKESNIVNLPPLPPDNDSKVIPFPDAPNPNTGSAVDVDKMFLIAKKDFNSGDYERAKKEFIKLAADFPSNELADDCLFWVAECDYKAKKYATAINAYKQVLATYPKSETSAGTLYKLGLCFDKTGKKEEASKAWKKLIESFPSSDEAALAKARLGS